MQRNFLLFLAGTILVVAVVFVALQRQSKTQKNTAPAGNIIKIEQNRFIPTSLTVSIGDSITFTNNDSVVHQIMSDPHPLHTGYPPLNIGLLTPGQSASVSFTQKGSFGFHDHLQPSIKGQIVVE